MKKSLVSFLFLSICLFGFTQAKFAPLKLNNALVVSHLDKQADQFSLEIAVSDVLSRSRVKNTVSLNVLKAGGDPQVLMTDSLTQLLNTKGINTLMLVSVRGFDNRFRPSTGNMTLAEDLAADNLFPIYKEDITSVTFEFHFYRGGKLVYADLLKIDGAGSRDKVLRKFRKKLAKKVQKDWI
jgi:hypothetical protein